MKKRANYFHFLIHRQLDIFLQKMLLKEAKPILIRIKVGIRFQIRSKNLSSSQDL